MSDPMSQLDPRGLIREAFAIEGIDASQCRSIFFDWALGLPAELEDKAAIRRLLEYYVPQQPDHPMIAVLQAGLETSPKGRRGGWRSRPR